MWGSCCRESCYGGIVVGCLVFLTGSSVGF